MGTSLLATWKASDRPDDILRATARAAAERFELLLWLPELLDYLGRSQLEAMAKRAIRHYREVSFDGSTAPSIDPLTIEVSLLPESSVLDEVVFMCVTQVCETVFQAVADILAAAEAHVAYTQARQAADALSVASGGMALLQQAGGVLAPMKIEHWQALREFIELPSAIQSEAYRRMIGHLSGLIRILGHARYPEWEQPHVVHAGTALLSVIDTVRRWEALHLGLAKKYAGIKPGAPVPDTLVYLERQLRELKEVIEELRRRYAGDGA